MKDTSRWWIGAKILFLAAIFLFPLWKITLEAPQYPEPLGLRIWAYKLTGISPHDIQNINLLNHYIGMKEIHAHSIPELRWMPWLLGFLIAFGVVCMVFLRRWLLLVWVSLSCLLAVLGLVDFYIWQYDYGHQLNPDAPIKIPGMFYQPPFLGSKQLLNITASSYPDLGGFLFGFALLFGVIALWVFHRRSKAPLATPHLGLLVGLSLALTACSPKPQPIVLHKDTCHRCQMMIADARFGSELLTPKGRAYKYDSIECLIAATLEHPQRPIHSLWVTDFLTPGRLLPSTAAHVLYHPTLPSPMGLNLHAFASLAALQDFQAKKGGTPLSWAALPSFVRQRWSIPSNTPAPASRPASRSSSLPPIRVSPDKARSLAAILKTAAPFQTILLQPGRYALSDLRIERPLHLAGQPGVIFDGQGRTASDLLSIEADHVTVTGITFQGVAPSFLHDRAAIRVKKSKGCLIEGNTFLDTFFAIYLENAEGCRVTRNTIRGKTDKVSHAGNGIHLWKSRESQIHSNQIQFHRDGIYLEFSEKIEVVGNLSSNNLRYGLHFMFSHDASYQENVFEKNGSGVAVMYTRRVRMHRNAFLRNWGSAAYGLLLKDIADSQITENCFWANTTGLFAEGTTRLSVSRNLFDRNGYALKLLSNTTDTTFQGNHFLANTFDVSSNPTENHSNRFTQNYWTSYQGYDLDRDGWGDVPYYPVRLFSVWVEQQPASLIFLRSFFVQILDTAERIMPALTPPHLVDRRPRYRPEPAVASLCGRVS